jgi:SRSO17 transposase
MQAEEMEVWEKELDVVMGRVGRRFRRAAARERAKGYIRGLVSEIKRKNGWQLAEHIGDPTPDGVQRLLSRAVWDVEGVREDERAIAVELLGDPEGILVVDETGFVKKGIKSAGVKRQYSGTAGRIENCQIGVFLGYASAQGYALIDRELYLPAEWAQDQARRVEAGVPQRVAFATKPELARQMLERAFEAGVPARWVTGDTVYGDDRRLRLWLEERFQPFVLAVSCNEALWHGFQQIRADELVAQQADQWVTLSAGEGAKGPRLYEWMRVPLARLGVEPGWAHWLLVRRHLNKPDDLAYYVVFAPAETSLSQLVRVAGARWPIEEGLEFTKDDLGLDHYEVRHWAGWYRHVTLVLLAQVYLIAVRQQAQAAEKNGSDMRPDPLFTA